MNHQIETATYFLNAYFPNCLAAQLCGSAAEGNATPYSDLDIIVLIPEGSSITIDNIIFNGISIEAIKIPANRLKQVLIGEAANRYAAQLRMILTGHILVDKINIIESLKLFSHYYYSRGPAKISTKEVASHIFMIKISLSALQGNRPFGELIFIHNQLIEDITTLLLNHHGIWQGQSKWKAKLLRLASRKSYEELEQVLGEYWKERKSEPIVEFTSKVLKYWDSPLEYSTSEDNPLIYSSERLTIAFRWINQAEYALWIKHFYLVIEDELQLEDSYFFFNPGIIDLHYGGEVILVIPKNSITNSDYLKLKIEKIWTSFKLKLNANQPTNYQFLSGPFSELRIGSNELVREAEKLFSVTSKSVKSRIEIGKINSISYAIYTLYGIGTGFNMTLEEFHDIISYSLNNTLTLFADGRTFEDPTSLQYFKAETLLKFDLKNQNDKHLLISTFTPLFRDWGNVEIDEPWYIEMQEKAMNFYSKLSTSNNKNSNIYLIPEVKTDYQFISQVLETILNTIGINRQDIPYTFFLTKNLTLLNKNFAKKKT